MSQLNHRGFKFKIFVKEQNKSDSNEIPINKSKFFTVSPLSGEKAKEFYEELIKEGSSSHNLSEKHQPIPKPKPKPPVHCKKQFKKTDLLALAQNNDVKNLELFFSSNQNPDINIMDDFGWTPLMCASYSGAEYAVAILLDNGADPSICDRLGNTALTLAKRKNWENIIQMLECSNNETEECEEVQESPESFFCPACKENFTMNKKQHDSSTLHLFNCKIKTSTFYGIPECNKGFQMLLKKGWDKEKGLGSDGTGRKFPIKAKMKKDKLGIGAEPPEPPKRPFPHTQKYESKKEKLYEKWREKDFEKNFRYHEILYGMEDPDKSLKYLQELESLGEEILTDRQEIIALDKRRNQTREGLRELKHSNEEKTWFAFGPLLVKLPTKKIEDILKKDQIQVDAEINKLRSNLKVKVNNLRDMEHQPPVPGLMLKAMTPEEMNAVGQVLGRHAN